MLKYSSTSYMGFRMINLTYGSLDNVNDVASWFNTYLVKKGWQVTMTAGERNARNLVAYRGNSMIVLKIFTQPGYTNIEIDYQGPE